MLRALSFLAALALVVIASSACPGPDWPKCENDDHCKEKDDQVVDYVCVFGQCQECGRDADCKGGKKCKRNRCIAPCQSDAQCGKGMACNRKTGACVKGTKLKGKKGDKCVETGDCQRGLVCTNQKCADKAAAGGTGGSGAGTSGSACKSKADCKGDLVCHADKCMSAEEAEMARTAAEAAGGELCEDTRVFFAFNLHDLNPEAREILDGLARCLSNNADKRISIEGHADERGTTQYNLDLGDRRARGVKEYMSRLGVDKGRIGTVSFGEEKPLEPASNEGAWSLNRRAEIKFK